MNSTRAARPFAWNDAIARYLTSLQAAGRSPGTVRLHRHYLAQLAARHRSPRRVTTEQLQQLLATPGWSPETRKSCRTVLRGFYRWMVEAGQLDVDPAARLGTVRVPAGCARPTPENIVKRALLEAPPRERLMIMLAALAGLRCGEIARLHADDVAGDVLRVRGKGGRVREVPLAPPLVEALAGRTGWIFPGRTSAGHMTPGHVSRLLSRALPAGWTGHTLRHRMATRAYAGTRDLLAVSALLGHSRPETTQRYIRLPDDAIRQAVAAAAVA